MILKRNWSSEIESLKPVWVIGTLWWQLPLSAMSIGKLTPHIITTILKSRYTHKYVWLYVAQSLVPFPVFLLQWCWMIWLLKHELSSYCVRNANHNCNTLKTQHISVLYLGHIFRFIIHTFEEFICFNLHICFGALLTRICLHSFVHVCLLSINTYILITVWQTGTHRPYLTWRRGVYLWLF